jgi:uncharacterized protein
MQVLSDAHALSLLAANRFGRIAFGHGGWPVILPVNYAYDEPTVVLRSAPGAKLDETPLCVVAFEVDDADPGGAWGWSVLVQGPAFDITDADDERSRRLRSLPIPAWAPGVRDHWLTISAVRVSGRAFGAVPAFS